VPWVVAISLVIFLILITRFFVINAQTIRRDLNTRFDRIQTHLADEAHSVVDNLLKAGDAEDRRSESERRSDRGGA
jgi:F0F1-type ATP synthase membrane subunit b/b'